MKTLNVEAKVQNLKQVLSFIDEELRQENCSKRIALQIEVAVEELFVNIAHYAYINDTGDVCISISVSGDPRTAEISFADSGTPFDPLAQTDPDVTLDAERRNIGGLGIFMVKKSMDKLLYEYRDGLNITTIRKRI